jgi:prevent-host-death family protein
MGTMSQHSVAEARNRLSDLIDRALAGEGVVITRHGRPVVELKPVQPPARAISDQDLDWLAARRVGLRAPKGDAGQLVSGMRDEDDR